MQMQKKITRKEDGRFLVYYHFPDTATAEETQVFESIEAIAADTKDERRKTDTPQASSVTPPSEAAHV